MRHRALRCLLILSGVIAGCAGVAAEKEEPIVRLEIQAQLDRCVEATRVQDIDVLHLRCAIETKVDSVELSGSAATVYTSQRSERQMLERDGKTIDHVVMTQKHRETWRHTEKGWMNHGVEELGSEVWVNGKRYEP
jgi:hypothetical protein